MEIINEATMPEEPEPKKQQQFEPDTAESGGVASDSGINDAIRRSCSDDQSLLLFDNVSSIKDFRKSQRVKKITQQPRFLKKQPKFLNFKFLLSVIDIWSAQNATLKNTSRLTTLKRNGDNKKRE